MSFAKLLDELKKQQVKLWVEGENLRVQSPKGGVTPDLRDRIIQSKHRLMAWLKGEPEDSDQALPLIEAMPSERNQPFPLTEIQQAYWLGRNGTFTLGNVSTHGYMEYEYTNLDVELLTTALNRVIARHDMLQAVVLPDGQQQVLTEVPEYRIPVLNLCGMNEDEQAAQLAAIRQELSHQILPLDRSPLLDIRVTQINQAKWVIHLSIDIIMFDVASLFLLFQELEKFYREPDAVLPAVALSFRDYVLAEKRLKGLASYEKAKSYWQKRIETLPPAVELPLAQLPASLVQQRFQRRFYRLAIEPWQKLKAKAQQLEVSASILLLTIFANTLKTWSKQSEFTLNLTLFNRLPLHPSVSQVIGDFTNLTLLAIKDKFEDRDGIQVSKDSNGSNSVSISMAEQAKLLQQQLWQALEHRDFSGVDVIRAWRHLHNYAVDGSIPIVFTSAIGVGKEGADTLFHLFDGDFRYGISQTPQIWLDHQLFEGTDGLYLIWDAVEELFPAGMLDDMFAVYCAFIEQLASNDRLWHQPHQPLLPDAQQSQRVAVNNTGAPLSGELLHTLFLQQVVSHAAQPAVLTTDKMLTYQELYLRANQVGHWLRQHGAVPNTLVAIVMEKGWEQVVAVLGILMAGAAYLPIDPTLPSERQRYLLQHGEVNLLLSQEQLADKLIGMEEIKRLYVDTLPLDPNLPRLSLMQQPTDLAYVIYTSGSTGLPKGVMIDHRGAVNTVLDINRRFGVTDQDRVLALSALNFDLSVYDIFGLLAVGGSIVVPDPDLRNDPAHWLDLMTQHRVTLWDTVPALMQMLVDTVESREEAGETQSKIDLRLVMLSGDWIPVLLPNRIKALWNGVTVYGLGGATEASIWSNYFLIEQVDPTWPSIPYGKPLTNQSFQVLDANLNPRPVWVPGDLYIGGIGLALGYWKDEEKTQSKFITHPQTGERLYKTGDLARYLPDGNLEFLGREDFQVKIRGHRIELGEIESVLLQHSGIKEAVVNAVGDPKGHRQLVAYVVASEPLNHATEPSTAGNIPDGYIMPSADATYPPGLLSDPVARLEFKLRQPGVRTWPSNGKLTNHDWAGVPGQTIAAIQLPAAEFDLADQEVWLARQSYRRFTQEVIPLCEFSRFLRCLLQMPLPGAPMPKYRYPSAGNLYPVQTYLYVKPERIEGLPAGFYYHQPVTHRLLPLSREDGFLPAHYAGSNQPIFTQAAFSLFLVADMAAIEPMYGSMARDFALLEAGTMSQLLMQEAVHHQLGLCPIGGLSTKMLQGCLHLQEQHQLLHSLVGGRINPDQSKQWLQNVSQEKHENLSLQQLQQFLKSKLPDYMVPTLYIPLTALPLTPNGKVDRKALPDATLFIAQSQTMVPPRTATEQMLATLWCDLLKVEQVSIDDNFFSIGGDSLLVTQVMAALRTQMEISLPLRMLFEKNTIADLAEHIDFQMAAVKMASVDLLAADEEEGVI